MLVSKERMVWMWFFRVKAWSHFVLSGFGEGERGNGKGHKKMTRLCECDNCPWTREMVKHRTSKVELEKRRKWFWKGEVDVEGKCLCMWEQETVASSRTMSPDLSPECETGWCLSGAAAFGLLMSLRSSPFRLCRKGSDPAGTKKPRPPSCTGPGYGL